MPTEQPTSEVAELTQAMIRSRCVNDGSPESGQEVRNVDLLASFFDEAGVTYERYDSAPGRSNLVARIEGSDPDAPSLCLLGHTDVVPVNEERWRNDPFGGEIIDGELWGRGAIDMFNLTASMAVATKRFATEGFRPKGTLVYVAVADEEAGGIYGAEHLVHNHTDAVRTDCLITESGGFPMETPEGIRLPALVEEKGLMWSRLRVHGSPAHGSMPHPADNALVKAAEVVRRIDQYRPLPRIDDVWRSFVSAFGLPPEMTEPLLKEEGFNELIDVLPVGMAKIAYASTHTTITPTMVHAGSKVNIIPEQVDIELDVRVLPGDGPDELRAMINEAVGDLAPAVELFIGREDDLATATPPGTPLWEAMERAARRAYPDATVVPMRMIGGTDARHFRRVLGTASYGFGLFSRKMSLDQLATMGHGDDERIDLESLDLAVELWDNLVRDFLG
jgi:acetylornithine deacetylase/succinyl-diaminopimelate desuccinylase-like protein